METALSGKFSGKDDARRWVWDRLVLEGIARPPFPAHGRIPNFQGAKDAARRLFEHPPWRDARFIKVSPDSPQRWVRLAALELGKIVLVPTPKLAGGFFRLVELAQAAPERLAALVEAREADATATNVAAAQKDREVATETLRKAIDKPPGLRLRLLGKQAEQLLSPLKVWRDAIIDHASELDRQATLWAEARLIERLRADAEQAALALQLFEISLRQQLSGLRQPKVGANALPTSGVVVLPGGAVDANDAAASVAQGVVPADPGLDSVELSSLTGSAEPLVAAVRGRLRQRLGAAEQRLTLAGALASLPATGPGRAAIDAARSRIDVPLLGPRSAAGTELVIAALPADVDPESLGLPEDVSVVRSGRLEDGLLMRLVADVPVEGLGLRKSALDEAVARLEQRRPDAPDLLWRRFPPA